MDFPLLILSALSGWCGTVPRHYFPPIEVPRRICPRCGEIASIAGGVIAAMAAGHFFPGETGLVPTIASGFIGGRVADRAGSRLGGMLGLGK